MTVSFLFRSVSISMLVFLTAHLALGKDGEPPSNEVGGIPFAGASGISHWETRAEDFKEYKVISRACNGKVMPDMVANIDKFFPFKPSIILMQLGGNDMAGGARTPELMV